VLRSGIPIAGLPNGQAKDCFRKGFPMTDPTVSLDSIVKHFESLPDPRHMRNRRHFLIDVITLAVCGVIVDYEGPTRSVGAKE